MRFAVQDRLIEVRDVPALRNRVLEEFRQFGEAWPVKLLRQVRKGTSRLSSLSKAR